MSSIPKQQSATDVMEALLQNVAANATVHELRVPKNPLSYFFLASKMAEVGKGSACGTRRSITYSVIDEQLEATLGMRLQKRYGMRTVSVSKNEFCAIVTAVFSRSDLPVKPMTARCWRELGETLERKQKVKDSTRPYSHMLALQSRGAGHQW